MCIVKFCFLKPLVVDQLHIVSFRTACDKNYSNLLRSGVHFTVRARRHLHPQQKAVCAEVYTYEQTYKGAHAHIHTHTLTAILLRLRSVSKVCFCNCPSLADCLTSKQRCGLALQCARNSNKLWLTRGKAESNRNFIVRSKAHMQPFFYSEKETEMCWLRGFWKNAAYWSIRISKA